MQEKPHDKDRGLVKTIDNRVFHIIPSFLKERGFTDRKLTDTPTDDLQVVNKKYVDDNGSAKSATFIIGPSSNSDSSRYDYRTDGINDEVQIQAAIDALPTNGGRIIFREGTYTLGILDGTNISSSKNGIILEGQGRGTIIKFANNFGDSSRIMNLTGSRCKVKNIYFDGNRANIVGGAITPLGLVYLSTGTNCEVSGCYFVDAAGIGVSSTGNGNMIYGNEFRDCDAQYVDTKFVLYVGGNCIIANNYLVTSLTTVTTGMIGQPNAADVGVLVIGNYITLPNSSVTSGIVGCGTVTNNRIEIGTSYTTSTTVIITCFQAVGNQLYFGTTADVDSVGIDDVDQIVGNFISGAGEGIKGTDADIISNNDIEEGRGHGIRVNNNQTVVSNNKIQNVGKATNNTYSGILITVANARCIISGNRIRSGAVNKHQYGIRENSTTTGPNVITNNVCTDAITDQISIQHTLTDAAHNITA